MAAVHGVAKSRERLSDFTLTFHFHALCTNIQFGGHWVLQQNKYFPLTDKLKGQATNPIFSKDRSSFRPFT